MAQGNGTERLLVMHNDFVLVGPPADPAGVRGEKSALSALRRIAERRAPWISRDDGSGTDQLEKRLWKDAGLGPKGEPWYLVSGQGMGATLTLADQKEAYTLADRATYLARKATLQSLVLVEGDRALLNTYHVLPVNPAKFPGVKLNPDGAQAFARFLVAPETQRLIGEFGREKYGEPLFVPDAGKRARRRSVRRMEGRWRAHRPPGASSHPSALRATPLFGPTPGASLRSPAP